MIGREDFIFTIGYEGPAAVVDGQAKRRYGKLSTKELAEKGMFRAAYSSALYAKSREEMQTLLEMYNQTAGTAYTVDSSLDRLFGVFPVECNRAIIL
jgi:hypothetical protein